MDQSTDDEAMEVIRGCTITNCVFAGIAIVCLIIFPIFRFLWIYGASLGLSVTAAFSVGMIFMFDIPVLGRISQIKYSVDCPFEISYLWPSLGLVCSLLGAGFAIGLCIATGFIADEYSRNPSLFKKAPETKTPHTDQGTTTPGTPGTPGSQTEASQPLLYKDNDMINYGGIPSDQVPGYDS